METHINFTVKSLDALPLPEAGQRTTYHDAGGRESVKGLQLRVTSTGVKTFGVFRRIAGGKAERVTIGKFPDLSIEQARKKAKEIVAALADGASVNATKRKALADSMTVRAAVADYIERKRRGKDGLPLKERTKADYLRLLDHELATLADKPIATLTGAEIRKAHGAIVGERRKAYAAQVLRAVLNWHGVRIADNPFDRAAVAGKDRIVVPQARATGTTIPPERVGAWWRATEASTAGDYLRFLLLTGCRPSEPLEILVSDADLTAGRVVLRDTKNRSDHTILLSTQALAIVKRLAAGKKPGDYLVGIRTVPKKAIATVVADTGVEFSAKTLRATFASIAEQLCSAYVLKRMMNHAGTGDVTGTHYVRVGEAQLRAGWQAVADWVGEQAADAAQKAA